MKPLALLAAILGLVITGSLTAAAGIRGSAPSATGVVAQRYTLVRLPYLGRVRMPERSIPLQAAATSTPGTPNTTPVPTETPTTGPTYPDPVDVLQKMITVLALVQTSGFEITFDGEQTGVVKQHVDAPGDATCKGPSLKATVKANETLEGTAQKKNYKYSMINVGKSFYLKSKSTHNKWKKTKEKSTEIFGLSISNPLICNASAGTGGGSGNAPTIKDVVNLGPSTFEGHNVWHIQATEVATDSNGQSQEATLDFLIDQDHYLPYVYSVTVNDAQQGVSIVFKQILRRIGEKVTIKAPKVGSTKP